MINIENRQKHYKAVPSYMGGNNTGYSIIRNKGAKQGGCWLNMDLKTGRELAKQGSQNRAGVG
jgi:hypothetical protein